MMRLWNSADAKKRQAQLVKCWSGKEQKAALDET